MYFTTSWDDGHPLDCTIADMLNKHGMKGTFYICRDGQDGHVLTKQQIQQLHTEHEVGAHTLTHPSLISCSNDQLKTELVDGKKWLEDATGSECTMFAYPYGHVDQRVRDAVEAAGYSGARTTRDLVWDIVDPFMMPTSVQVHHFPFRPVFNRRFVQPLRMAWPQIRSIHLPLRACRSWYSYAVASFEYARKSNQPFFHLWGHSWTAERDGFMNDIDRFLVYVSQYDDLEYCTNSELRRLF